MTKYLPRRGNKDGLKIKEPRHSYSEGEFVRSVLVLQRSRDFEWKIFKALVGDTLVPQDLTYFIYQLKSDSPFERYRNENEKPTMCPNIRQQENLTPAQLEHSLTHMPKDPNCDVCRINMRRRPARRLEERYRTRATKAFERIHIDLTGPIRADDDEPDKWVFVARDDASSYLHVSILLHKDHAFDHTKRLWHEWRIPPGAQLMTDCGGEFGGPVPASSDMWLQWEREANVFHHYAIPYEPTSNARAERAVQDAIKLCRSALVGSSFSNKYWISAMKAAVANYSRSYTVPRT